MADIDQQQGLPSVAILGGCGFIGRNLVQYLLSNNLVSRIKIGDKCLPALAFLPEDLKHAYKNDERVKFKQSDLAREDHVNRFFDGENFDYVFNLCGETRQMKTEEDYRMKTFLPAEKCSAKAEEVGVRKWIEVSTAQVYDKSSKQARSEDAKLAPWTLSAQAHLNVEKMLQSRTNLPVVILRPCYVYGPGDRESLMPRVMCAAVYKRNNETMKFLWKADVTINTVHVRDLCLAMWACAERANGGSLYNLADKSNFDQGKMNAILSQIFEIRAGFVGRGINMVAKMALGRTAEASNDKHVPAWSEICMEHGVLNTPLSPFMGKEILQKAYVCINGSKIENELGFQYQHPEVTVDLIREMIDGYKAQGLFPNIV